MADDQIEAVVERAVFGTLQIGTRRWGWVRSAEGMGAKIGRGAIGAGLLYSGGALALQWPWVGAGEIATLILWGYAKAKLDQEEQPAAEAEPELEPSSELQVLDMVLDFLGDDTAIHLDTLLDRFRTTPDGTGMTRDDLRRLLAATGCPVRRAVRVGNRTGVAGVHRDDARTALEALAEDPTPLPPPGAAPDV